jgi:hypothetical protein
METIIHAAGNLALAAAACGIALGALAINVRDAMRAAKQRGQRRHLQ